MAKIKRICKTCGKEFKVKPSRVKYGRGKYCSLECRSIAYSKNCRGKKSSGWKGGKIKRICKTCGKEIEVYPSIIRKGKGIYCSRDCWCIALSRNSPTKGEHSNFWKGGKIKRICLVCGREFEVFPSQIDKGGGKYCSQKCYALSNRKRTFTHCASCGKEFWVHPSQLARGGGRYCSVSCASKETIKKQRHDAKSQKTQPAIIFDMICKKYSLPFHFVGDGTLCLGRANPDFIHNTRKLVCEVFGDFWHSPLLNRNIKYTMSLEGRRKQLKAEGYKLIVLWESDLKRKDAEQFVLYTLAKY
ncbi:hypothetical protein KA005_08390, partial [bacterium]|nr:hypothetical protein [bacterium]